MEYCAFPAIVVSETRGAGWGSFEACMRRESVGTDVRFGKQNYQVDRVPEKAQSNLGPGGGDSAAPSH